MVEGLVGEEAEINKEMAMIWISELIQTPLAGLLSPSTNQLVFIALSHYQLNEREKKALEVLTMMFYGFRQKSSASKVYHPILCC